MRKRAQTDQVVHDISGARSGLSVEQLDRSKRYMWSMALRMACFIGALVVDGPLRWVLLAGSLVLPWVAVVVANAGRESGNTGSAAYINESGRELN